MERAQQPPLVFARNGLPGACLVNLAVSIIWVSKDAPNQQHNLALSVDLKKVRLPVNLAKIQLLFPKDAWANGATPPNKAHFCRLLRSIKAYVGRNGSYFAS